MFKLLCSGVGCSLGIHAESTRCAHLSPHLTFPASPSVTAMSMLSFLPFLMTATRANRAVPYVLG